MSKCRYELSEDCHNKDCLACVLDRIKIDVFNACSDNYHMPVYKLDCDEIFGIIDKYKKESEEFSFADLIDDIKEIPPAEPKTGHWIEGQTDDPNIHNIICSRCIEGYPSKGHANSQYTREKFKYCPNCGAKMIESQESEE